MQGGQGAGGEREADRERDQAPHLVRGPRAPRPRMPNVTRRLTAVLARAVSSRLTALAACAAMTLRSSRYSST